MTEFRKLAIKIAENVYDPIYCCVELHTDKAYFFAKFFLPDSKERLKYHVHRSAWMSSLNQNRVENNEDRILALLFAEQLWIDELTKKNIMKYQIYIYKGRRKGWYIRIVAKNGKIVADGGEPYSNKWNAKRAAKRLALNLVFSKIQIL